MKMDDSVSSLKGIGAKTEKIMNRIGIYTVGDCLRHYPRDYKVYEEPVLLTEKAYDEKTPAGYLAQVNGRPQLVGRGRTPIVLCNLYEGSEKVQAIWYHSTYIRSRLQPGGRYVFYGKITHRGRQRTLEHPEIYTEEEYSALQQTMQPVYGLTEGLSQKTFYKAVRQILEQEELFPDPMPAQIRHQYSLAEYNFAVRQIHFPTDKKNYLMARHRLVFDEFFMFAVGLRRLRRENSAGGNDFVMTDDSVTDDFIASLPYRLTGAQMRVWRQISADMRGPHAMNRLIQGDVGSGKTAVAALAMLKTAANGHQSCLMAPTEVLARQHYEKLAPMFGRYGYQTVLLTGAVKEKDKRTIRAQIADGSASMIIGTHAVFQEKVEYADLALIVTDEQHRFGVHQREMLAGKNEQKRPHVIVMSATPIPRTLAIILYSDLDISVIDEKPQNRLPIKNAVVGPSYRPAAWRFIAGQIKGGHQAYVICPLVEESEMMDAENVTDYSSALKKAFPADVRIGVLHGRMKPAAKDAVMQDFADGKIDLLVSTTVIEVGVDVPNATVMMIENAERFGLAQLHQLRGRVGRGSSQSYCIFMYGKESETTKERLAIMQNTNDGFKIAEQDMKLRGPGDLFGIRQSGSMQFAIADIYADADCLIEAGQAAAQTVDEDPDLTAPDHAMIRQAYEAGRFCMDDNVTL